jgi:hypothetical protein
MKKIQNNQTTYNLSQENIFFRGFLLEVLSRLASYLRKMFKNPSWFLMSYLGRFNFIRSFAVSFVKGLNIQKYQQSQFSNFEILCPNKVAELLKRDGFYTGIYLPENLLKKILHFAYSTPCYGNRNKNLGFLYSEKEKYTKEHIFYTAQYYNTQQLCPAIRTIVSDPKLLKIASQYLGAYPICTGTKLWWNFAVDDGVPYDCNQTITFFHYDLDDYATLRFFFYLTDVDKKAGPHVVMRGSHKNKSWAHVLIPVKRRTDKDIYNYYGLDNLCTIYGESGFGFAEDTFCFHKATRPLKKDRLMLQIQFAVYDYGLHNDLCDPSLLTRIN